VIESEWRDQNDHDGLAEGEKVIVTTEDGDVHIAWLFGGVPKYDAMTWWTVGKRGSQMLTNVVAWKRPRSTRPPSQARP
jgi:hypothetical protein